jgi:putative colanic acid biosynthesis UDP-glucose lipid carrier transferase
MMAMDQPMHEVIAEYSARHRMKPGITGWAQVRGCRGEINSHNKLRRRVAFDCEYINNWSLGFDMWIILRTAVTLLFDKNAY